MVIVVAVLFSACDDYDRWTTSPGARLSFSADTLSFDTIITDMTSSTQTLVAFNNGDDGLRSIRVELKGGASSLFKVNVDGQFLNGGVGQDFEVRRRDSLVVRAEVKLPEVGDDVIRHYEDRLVFTLESGVRQEVVLQADGMDVRIIRGKVVETDESLTAGMPYLVYDSLVVRPGATLTLEPGTVMLFHDDVILDVHGTLKAVGTQERPVVFRGDRMDRLVPDVPYDNTPNRWGGVVFNGTSRDNVLEYCDIHSGRFGVTCFGSDSVDSEHPMLVMKHSVIHNVGWTGLVLGQVRADIIGCQISNAEGQCVSIQGGDVRMIHCTIAQFYPFSADRQEALYLANLDVNGNYIPLRRAHFLNCVITGYADDVIMGNLAPENDEYCDYLFDGCLLRTVASDDTERFRDVVYDNEDLEPVNYHDHFVQFDTHYILYDFTPVDSSVICVTGKAEVAREFCPTDMRGRNFQASDGRVPCGAFANIRKDEE